MMWQCGKATGTPSTQRACDEEGRADAEGEQLWVSGISATLRYKKDYFDGKRI